MITLGIEFELKYSATAEALDAISAALSGDWCQITMETTYYDTPEHALSQRHYTLRRRLENGKSICTVKIPLEDTSRGEWETECPSVTEAIPVLCKLGAPKDLLPLTQAGVVTVCGARFIRRACTIPFADATLEVALDQGVLFSGAREIPLCELEVELKSGPREGAVLFAHRLAKTYQLQPQPRSKFRRALDLREEV